MAVRSTRRSPYRTQAQRDAALQFAPKRSALAEQLRTARDDYAQTVAAGRSTATLTKQAVNAALPQIAQIYGKADAAQGASATLLNRDLAALPAVADTFKAGASSEAQRAIQNLITARAQDSGMLVKKGVAAAAGAQFNQLNARAQLQKAVAGILAKGEDVAGEEGATAASEAEKLQHEADEAARHERENEADNATTERGQNLTRASAKESNQGSGGGGGPKQTADKQQSAASTIRELEGEVRSHWKQYSPAQIYKILTTEEPEVKENVIKKDQNGKPITHVNKFGKREYEYESVTHKAIPASNPLFVQAAIESATKYGRISKATLKKLHKAGYSISQLDLAPPNENGKSSLPLPPGKPAGRRGR